MGRITLVQLASNAKDYDEERKIVELLASIKTGYSKKNTLQQYQSQEGNFSVITRKISEIEPRYKDFLKKRCFMNELDSIEIFETTPSEIRLHVFGKSDNGKKISQSLLSYDDSALYEYHSLPVSVFHYSKPVRSQSKILYIDDNPESPTSPHVQFELKKHTPLGHSSTKKELTYDQWVYNNINQLKTVVNTMQRNTEKGSALLSVSDLLSPKNGSHNYQYVMPITSDQTARKYFTEKELSPQDRLQLLQQCIRDNFVAAECLRDKGYIITDQKLENSIVVQDTETTNELERTRFAQIDIDDIFNEHTLPPSSILPHTFPHPELSQFMDGPHDFSKKELATVIQLRNFFIMMIDGFFCGDKVHDALLDAFSEIKEISQESFYKKSYCERVLKQSLEVDDWENYSNVADYLDKEIIPQCVTALNAFGISNKDDLQCIKQLLFAPHALKEPNQQHGYGRTREAKRKDTQLLNTNINRLYAILKKALKVEDYKEPTLITQRRVTPLGSSEDLSDKVSWNKKFIRQWRKRKLQEMTIPLSSEYTRKILEN